MLDVQDAGVQYDATPPHVAEDRVPRRPYGRFGRCKNMSKQRHARCLQPAVDERGICKWHGARSVRGMESPTYVDGSRSKYLPADVRGRYLESLRRPDLLSLRENVALLDTRLNELLAKLVDGEAPQLWNQSKQALGTLKAALYGPPTASKPADVAAALAALETVISTGNDQTALWRDIIAVSRHQERLITSERTALREAQQMITVQQAMILVNQVAESVKRHVTDRKALAGVAGDIQRLLDHRGPDEPARLGEDGGSGS